MFTSIILLPILILGQSLHRNDTVEIYKLVIDSLQLNGKAIIAETLGTVYHYDLYGNFKESRRKAIENMEAQGYYFTVWVEPDATTYETTVITVLKEFGIQFDTITRKDISSSGKIYLNKLLPGYKFLPRKKAPLEYSYYTNFFKKRTAFGISELLFITGINVAVLKVTEERKDNHNEKTELIVLLKQNDEWAIIKRIKGLW